MRRDRSGLGDEWLLLVPSGRGTFQRCIGNLLVECFVRGGSSRGPVDGMHRRSHELEKNQQPKT